MESRILYLVAGFPRASETFVAAEVTGLRAMGMPIEVCAFKRPGEAEAATLSEEMRQLAAGTHYVGARGLLGSVPAAFGGALGSAGRRNRRLKTEAGLQANALARLLRAATVVRLARRLACTHLHAHWPAATQVAIVAHAISGIPWSVSIHAHEVAHDNAHFPIAFETLRFATFCNRAAMDYLLARLDASARARSHLIYHGVDTERFEFRPLPAIDGTIRLVSAGRLTHSKGFERLLQGVGRAVKLGASIELTIVGDGSLRDTLKARSIDLGLAQRVRFTGWVPHHQMASLLSDAHAFVLLADDQMHDGLPNVVLEAMSIGRAVIMTPLPAAREAVHAGQTGWVLSQVNAVEEFADLLLTISKNPGLLESAGRAARASVLREHDKKRHLSRLAELFHGSLM